MLEFQGRCDASAAVGVPAGRLETILVANDEDDRLEIHAVGDPRLPARAGGDFRERLSVAGGGNEGDLEGAAWLGDRVYRIGSHGRNAAGGRERRREQLLATRVVGTGAAVTASPAEGANNPYRRLVEDLHAIPELRAAIDLGDATVERLAPERGGLSIEGLAAGADGASLLLGLRSPLVPDGRAIVVPLLDPDATLASPPGTRARLGAPVLLDLGGRGIRSLEFVPPTAAPAGFYYVLAGTPGDGDDFALFSWPGRADTRPMRVPGSERVFAELTGNHDRFRPEAVVAATGGQRLLLLSDDGDRTVGGRECGKLPRERFRAVVLSTE